MAYIFSCDLGSTSIGWALVEKQSGKVIANGVRIFPEGVDRDQQGGELSKSEQRRISRGMRRQIARRSRRKRLLRTALVDAGLYPPNPIEQTTLESHDPYELRRRAISEKIEPFEIGRVLLHLNQRRGFLANRKTDRATKKEQSEMLKEISDLGEEIAKHGATLGSYLAHHAAKAGDVPTSINHIRGQHTHRDMLLAEFDAIWQKQRSFHPALLTDKLKYGETGRRQIFPADPILLGKRSPLVAFGLHGIIFYQRKMYWPLGAVGFCELEPRKRRCPRADRIAQRCRLYQEVNNLRLIDGKDERPLSSEERVELIDYLSAAKERKFDDIRKHLGLLEGVRFNLERMIAGDDATGGRTKLKGMETDAMLAHRDLFGKDWHKREEEEKDQIVRDLLSPALDERAIAERASQWGLPAGAIEKLIDTALPVGYSKFSREALARLEPHLKVGLPLMRNDLGETDKISTDAIHAAGYLRADERSTKALDELPKPPDLPNPLVRQALFEVRRVINSIIREHGKPDAIHIELARDVKGSLEKRRKTRLDQLIQQRRREEAAAAIVELKLGVPPSRSNINRYLLWKEQGEMCIYTGRMIPAEKLYGGEIDIDHILPYPRSLDNSMANRVICYRYANQEKKDQTPFEWLAISESKRYEEVLQRARKLNHYGKYQRFIRKTVELNEFINRQLVDTAYISRAVVQYVRQLGVDVIGTKGQYTADLRWLWGLDSVLRHDELKIKNREDHRHHAVDAIVIASTDRAMLQKLAHLRHTGEDIPQPWNGFREEVEKIVNQINVSFRVQRGVRGALHEETIYGATEQENVFVKRYDLNALTPEMATRIRDPIVKSIVADRLAQHGITPGRGGGAIPKNVWIEPEPLFMRQSEKNKRAEKARVAITSVRVLKPEDSVVGIRPGEDGTPTAFVKPGSLHHLCIFEFIEGKKTKREPIFVSMLEAARRKKLRLPLIQRKHPTRPDAKFIMSLSRGEMMLGPKGDGRLMVFNTAASTQGQIYFHLHTDARPANKKEKFVVTANSMSRDAKKVTVDPLGRIRWAND